MQRIITKRYHFTFFLLLSITFITNIPLASTYSQEYPTNVLFAGIGKDRDKSITPREVPREEVSPKIEPKAQLYVLFADMAKDIDKSVTPREVPREEVSPKIEPKAQLYDPREIIPLGVDLRTGNATGTVLDDIII